MACFSIEDVVNASKNLEETDERLEEAKLVEEHNVKLATHPYQSFTYISRNVAYYSIKDDVEQSRKLELAASDDLLLDNAKRRLPQGFETSPVTIKKTRSEYNNMTVVDQSVKLGMSSRKRKLPQEYEVSPRPTKRSKSEYPTNNAAQLPQAVNNFRIGKWKIYLGSGIINEVWEKVKLLLLDNQLGSGANVSRMGNRSYVIHILTYDYEDVRDVFRVLVAIRRHRFSASYLGYETATDPDSNQTDQGQQQASSGSAGNKRLRRNMYFSPSPAGNKDMVQLFSNKIGPGSEKKLVAEMKKDSDGTECETWYTPPKVVDAAAMEGPRVGRLDNNTKRTKEPQARGRSSNVITFRIDLNVPQSQ